MTPQQADDIVRSLRALIFSGDAFVRLEAADSVRGLFVRVWEAGHAAGAAEERTSGLTHTPNPFDPEASD